MNTTIKERGPQTVTLKMEVIFALGEKANVIDAMTAAEHLLAMAVGQPDDGVPREVTGTVVIGRQKFEL